MSNQRPSFAKRDREMRLKDKAKQKAERRATKSDDPNRPKGPPMGEAFDPVAADNPAPVQVSNSGPPSSGPRPGGFNSGPRSGSGRGPGGPRPGPTPNPASAAARQGLSSSPAPGGAPNGGAPNGGVPNGGAPKAAPTAAAPAAPPFGARPAATTPFGARPASSTATTAAPAPANRPPPRRP